MEYDVHWIDQDKGELYDRVGNIAELFNLGSPPRLPNPSTPWMLPPTVETLYWTHIRLPRLCSKGTTGLSQKGPPESKLSTSSWNSI